MLLEGLKARYYRDKLINDIKADFERIVLGFSFGNKYNQIIYESKEDFKIAREVFFGWLIEEGVYFLDRLDNVIVSKHIYDEVLYSYNMLCGELDFRHPKDLLVRLEELDDVLKKYDKGK